MWISARSLWRSWFMHGTTIDLWYHVGNSLLRRRARHRWPYRCGYSAASSRRYTLRSVAFLFVVSETLACVATYNYRKTLDSVLLSNFGQTCVHAYHSSPWKSQSSNFAVEWKFTCMTHFRMYMSNYSHWKQFTWKVPQLFQCEDIKNVQSCSRLPWIPEQPFVLPFWLVEAWLLQKKKYLFCKGNSLLYTSTLLGRARSRAITCTNQIYLCIP